jgi:uncharacterized repeat protein (TIGR03803 family)
VNPSGGFDVLHAFTGGEDGGVPLAGLSVAGDALYGTASSGGAGGQGVLFKLDPAGIFTVLHAFGGVDGSGPSTQLLPGADGALYGTTPGGGDLGHGVLFRIAPDGSRYEVLRSFAGNDGSTPSSALVQDGEGRLYGLTARGGLWDRGVLFSLSCDGLDFRILHDFGAGDGTEADGAFPLRLGLTQDGKIFGTTLYGGARGQGVLFVCALDGSDFSVAYAYTGQGDDPKGGFTVGTDGWIYGPVTVKGKLRLMKLALVSAPCPVITLSPATLPDGTLGTAYAQDISSSGGANPISFTVSTAPSDPIPGVAFSSSGNKGHLTGTPTATGTYNFTVTATDKNACTGTQNYTVVIACPAISLAALPGGTVNVAYNGSAAASGGTAPYTYMVTSGALPAGLSLNPNTGAVTGTPTIPSTFNFRITATDSNGCSGYRDYSVTIACGTITVSPASLPDGAVNAPYSQTISASGGTEPYAFSVTAGGLPVGLTLSQAGALSGTPTQGGSFTFTVTATDSSNCPGTRQYTFYICPQITLSPSPPLANGTVNVAYSQILGASGGTAPYTFAATGGSLPTGMGINKHGNSYYLDGTPTQTGSFTFTVTATDSNGCMGSQQYSLYICAAIAVSPGTLPGGTVNVPYSQTLSASGGTGPYTFAQTGGTLPTSLVLGSEGSLAGTPTAGGSFTFTVTATDSNGCTGSREYTVQICPAITLSPTVIANATVGNSYSQVVTSSGGAGGNDSWSLTNAPAWMSLSNQSAHSVILGGTPTQPGLFSFTLTCTDKNGCQGSQQYTLRVCPLITLSPATLPDGVIGSLYSQTISAAGGTGPCAFSVTAGGLPVGLTLSQAGALSGTPTQGGSFTFTVTATDANGCSGSYEYTINVCPVIVLIPSSAGTYALPGATLGENYTYSLGASGGQTPYKFEVTGGSLPSGMDLTQGGTVHQAPSELGTFTFTVTVTDKNGCTGSQVYSIAVTCPQIALIPGSAGAYQLPGATVGAQYSYALDASGGQTPYTFEVTSGNLPPGMDLSQGGTIHQAPTQAGTYTFTVSAEDRNGCTGSQAYSITVTCPAITISPETLGGALVGVHFSANLQAQGGSPPYDWTSTALPGWLNLNVNSGLLQGTPALEDSGTVEFTVTATDRFGCTATRHYTIQVGCPAIEVLPESLTGAIIGAPYTLQISAQGGVEPFTFEVTAGVLPDGFTLSPSGLLEGTLAGTGSWTFTVTATDTGGCQGSRQYTLGGYSAVFLDDGGGSRVCIDFASGQYAWNVLSGPEAGNKYYGTGKVFNAGGKTTSIPGDPVYFSVVYDPVRKTASGWLVTPGGVYVALDDSNTANNPEGCN